MLVGGCWGAAASRVDQWIRPARRRPGRDGQGHGARPTGGLGAPAMTSAGSAPAQGPNHGSEDGEARTPTSVAGACSFGEWSSCRIGRPPFQPSQVVDLPQGRKKTSLAGPQAHGLDRRQAKDCSGIAPFLRKDRTGLLWDPDLPVQAGQDRLPGRTDRSSPPCNTQALGMNYPVPKGAARRFQAGGSRRRIIATRPNRRSLGSPGMNIPHRSIGSNQADRPRHHRGSSQRRTGHGRGLASGTVPGFPVSGPAA